MMNFHNIPILVYHKLSEQREKKSYTIDKGDFNNQMKYIYHNQYKCILVDDYVKSIINPLYKIPLKSVVITFDDGYESDFKIAMPILQKYNFKATFFITSDWIGSNGYMKHKQLQCLQKKGMSVQSHAKTHMFLDSMSKYDIFEEIKHSKDVIENILDKEVPFISFPGGRYNKDVIACAEKLGIQALFSSDPYYCKNFGNIQLIGRCMIKYTSNGNNFIKLINLQEYEKLRLIGCNYGKKILQKILGDKLYHGLWEIIVSK